MTVRLLDDDEASALRSAPLSYPRPDHPDGVAPAGFDRLSRSVTTARRDLDGAARDLLGWRVHSRAGLRVRASDIPLVEGTVVLMRWGPGPLSVRIPCRVVSVVDEPDRRGFAYGTLPGHPEAGEEWFVLDRLVDGRIRFTVSAFSRPATRLARVGGPATRVVQRIMTDRYLAALDGLQRDPARRQQD